MTPQYILGKSLCREPHCASGENWKRRATNEIENLRWSADYAEPGYTAGPKGILFANWNYFPSRIADTLERAGFSVEWSDEWTFCEDCGKALRTSADCWSWQPSFALVGECSEICIDCLNGDAAEYLESLEDNPHTALNIPKINPAEWGYVLLEDQFESGWHPGQTDNPEKIFARLRTEGKTRILFRIDEVQQFTTRFSVWIFQGEEITTMYAYTFTIETQGEFDALAWASARWDGATKLYDLMHPPEDWDGESFPVTMGLKEHEAWEVQSAIEAEDSGFIPCLAESLNSRIMAMFDSIV